jgi:hypothetical protein
VVGGARLAAVRARLLERAQALGHAVTTHPALRLDVDGRAVRARVDGRTHRFRLPKGASRASLVSLSAVPAFLWPESGDYRRLGVAVSRIVLNGRDIGLDDARLGAGWQAIEPGWRWTRGEAALDVSGADVLEIEVVITGRYWLKDSAGVLAA